MGALTPEERVRQDYLFVLINEYGYSLDQIDEEISVTSRGSAQARADFLIWRTPEAKKQQEHALIVIECKADNVTISLKDYVQGANYAQYEHARFFVTHNHRETKYWKVDDKRRMPNYDEIANIPHADATDKEIDELLARLKDFKEDEIAKLLHECHNVIRNREKLDPAAAFDEIAKILFVKVYVERELRAKRARRNLFSVEYLDDQLGKYPLNTLFGQTKEAYADTRSLRTMRKYGSNPPRVGKSSSCCNATIFPRPARISKVLPLSDFSVVHSGARLGNSLHRAPSSSS